MHTLAQGCQRLDLGVGQIDQRSHVMQSDM
jgi:hypothetical protein